MKVAVKHYDPSREYFLDEGCHINELCNAPDDDQASIAQARLEVGNATRWHALRDTAERYVIVSGEGDVEVGDMSPRRVGAGDVVVIPAEVRQRITNVGAVDLVFLVVCTPPFVPEVYIDLE